MPKTVYTLVPVEKSRPCMFPRSKGLAVWWSRRGPHAVIIFDKLIIDKGPYIVVVGPLNEGLGGGCYYCQSVVCTSE